ncbi:MAG: hypothetical protein HOF58_01655 [Candidatus Marinimicrobia bacterium]|mgnify:FL=1|nr:hypothetical protein [Candidatus Neomarinimicrobiota bacterium]
MIKKKTIFEWAARYDIENDEQLWKSLQDLRKCGGTVGMKTFLENIHNRVVIYNQIIQSEIDQKVEKATMRILVIVLLSNVILLFAFHSNL